MFVYVPQMIGSEMKWPPRGSTCRMSLLATEAGLDYRVVPREGYPAVELSFDASDEGDHISGRGSAVVNGDRRGRRR
jgi:hypothetical protein